MPSNPKKDDRIALRAVSKTSVCEDIARQIMKLIAKGDLKPGQRLPSERDLCEDFGVGRSSVREALRCLSIIGVLDARVGEGTSVSASGGKFLGKLFEWRLVTEEHDLEKLMDVRLALESVTAADVARNATEDQIAGLQALIKRMKECLKDPARYSALDTEFHLKLAEASTNSILSDLVNILRGQLSQSVQRALGLPKALPLSQREHEAIVVAIAKRDPIMARHAMEAHLMAAVNRYRSSRGESVVGTSKNSATNSATHPGSAHAAL